MRRSNPAVWLVVSILSLPSWAAAQPPAWTEDLDLLATEREKSLFSGLRADSERGLFFQQFWQARDPFPETSRNELREEWEARLVSVRERWGRLDDERARVFLLRGKPTAQFEAQCPASGSFEVWVYEPAFRRRYRTVLVFSRGEGQGGPWRLWRPGSSPDVTAAAAAEACSNQERLKREASWIRLRAKGEYRALLDRALSRPRPREWTSRFRATVIAASEDPAPLDASLRIEHAGRQDGKVTVRFLLIVPAQTPAEGLEHSVAGQVLRNGELADSFHYRLRGQPARGGTQLVFERPLEPGSYTLRLRLEDATNRRFQLAERALSVPEARLAAAELASAPVLAEADAALSSRPAQLRLLAPPQPVLVGPVRFSAEIEPSSSAEERIERVVFTLDGKPLLTRTHPPFDVEIDLGPVPRLGKLRAEGIASDGAVVARDEMLINGGTRDFRVRLLEPRSGRRYQRSLRIVADVTAPPGAAVERLELWFGEERIATLYQPPYSMPFALPRVGQAGDLRAVAYLAGGGSCEDVAFINMAAEPIQMNIRVVELYTSVLDGSGKPVRGDLSPAAFEILEDGQRQQIQEIERVGDTPVRVVELIDSSLSMADEMEQTRQAALGFLKRLLRPQDQAAVMAFNHSPEVIVPLTGDLGQLEEGLEWVLAEGTTALYDSVVAALQFLDEARGQRAVLLLSDGLDRSSRLGFEQALEAARRGGITLYAIGLGLEDGPQGEAAKNLTRLAEVTGGRSFFARDASGLAAVYEQIETELRAQHRISYQSSNTSSDGAFRKVQLRAAKPGLEARTISGYYP